MHASVNVSVNNGTPDPRPPLVMTTLSRGEYGVVLYLGTPSPSSVVLACQAAIQIMVTCEFRMYESPFGSLWSIPGEGLLHSGHDIADRTTHDFNVDEKYLVHLAVRLGHVRGEVCCLLRGIQLMVQSCSQICLCRPRYLCHTAVRRAEEDATINLVANAGFIATVGIFALVTFLTVDVVSRAPPAFRHVVLTSLFSMKR